MTSKPLSEMTQDEIKTAVREKYSRVASDPCASFNLPVGKEFALKVGYPKEILDKLPQSMYESFTGVTMFLSYSSKDIRPSLTMLDLIDVRSVY